MLHGQGDLDEAGHAGGGVGVANVALDRADAAKTARIGALAEGLAQGGDLDRVAHGRAGAVGLDVGDGFRRNVGQGQRFGDGLRLAVDAGREVAHLAGAVVVDGRAFDDGVDVVAVLNRIGQTAQHHDAHRAAEHRAFGVGIEGMAVAIGRQDLALVVEVAVAVRQLDRDATGQGHVAFAVEQALHTGVDGHQRGRAGGLHVDARALEVQQVGNAGGQEVFVVAGVAHQEETDGLHQLRVGQQVVGHVGVVAGATEHADGAGKAAGHVAGVFQRFPGALEKVAVLGVHDGRFARAEAEERRVEHLHVGQHGAALDVVGVVQHGRADPGGEQLFVGEGGQGLHAVAQVVPVLGNRAGTREAPGHADHGDVGVEGVTGVRVAHVTLITQAGSVMRFTLGP